MIRASVPDILRQNLRFFEGLLADHLGRWPKEHDAVHMTMPLDLDEVRHIIEDLHEVLGRIEKEGDHGTTTS